MKFAKLTLLLGSAFVLGGCDSHYSDTPHHVSTGEGVIYDRGGLTNAPRTDHIPETVDPGQ